MRCTIVHIVIGAVRMTAGGAHFQDGGAFVIHEFVLQIQRITLLA